MTVNLSQSISTVFKDKKLLTKKELMAWLADRYPDLSEETLSWRIHDLKSKGILENPGRGLYRLASRDSFQPVLSHLSKRIGAMLNRELPLIQFCIWETRWLDNWMELQPIHHLILVEVEKEALAAVFNHLSGVTKKVFLQPSPLVVERYVLPLDEAIIVKPLLSEAPLLQAGKIPTATPEKILVDILSEPQLFTAQQGELERIFENAFSETLIHQNRMLRYARRRKREKEVLRFIPENHRVVSIS